MNIWSDRIVTDQAAAPGWDGHGGPALPAQFFADDSGRTFTPGKVVQLLSAESEGYDNWWLPVKKLLDYDMIWLPDNKPLAKKLEALGLTVII
jgi:hypothetical protein